MTYRELGLDSSKLMPVIPECPCGCHSRTDFHISDSCLLAVFMGRYLKVNGRGRNAIFALTYGRNLYAGIHTAEGFSRLSLLELPSKAYLARYLELTKPNLYEFLIEEEPGIYKTLETEEEKNVATDRKKRND